MLSSLFSIFATTAFLHLTTASPLHAQSHTANLQSRDTSTSTDDCTNIFANSSTGCWDKLDIADYLASWNRTTPSYPANDDDAACCSPSEPWTTCFLRLSYDDPGTDCTQLGPQFCSLRPLSPALDPSIAPKVRYVVNNIVSINSFFSSYDSALARSDTSEAEKLYDILGGNTQATQNNLNAILGGNSLIGATLNNLNVVKAFAAGLPFWGTPAVVSGGPQQIGSNVNPAVIQAFTQSLQNTQVVSSQLFGTPYNATDVSNTQSGLAYNLGEARKLLQQTLSHIMSDVPTFTSWAAHGLYSGSTPDLSRPANFGAGLTSPFTTYLVGAALSQSHFSATPAASPVSKAAFQNGRTCTPLGDVCKDSSNQTYYWSQAFGTTFAVNEPKSWANGVPEALPQYGFENNAYGLLGQIEASNVYMPVLFDGAYNCTLEGKAGGSAVNVNADGSLDVACLSSLPIYLAKGSSCPSGAVKVRGKCPFGFLG